jgi:hypothetical protein
MKPPLAGSPYVLECLKKSDIKCFLSKGKLLSIPQLKAQVRESSCLARLFSNRQRRFSQIDPHRLAPGFRKGSATKPGPVATSRTRAWGRGPTA